jgi:abhydrolase domain-containing protein 17
MYSYLIGGTIVGLIWYGLSRIAETVVFMPPPVYSERTTNLQFVENTPIIEYTVNDSNAFTLIHSHGNACNLVRGDYFFGKLSKDLNVNIVAYDYQGYGPRSKYGRCSEKACYRDIERVYEYVRSKGVPANRIVLMGVSLGSGPSYELATKVPVAGLIIRSGYTSIVRVAATFIGYTGAELLARIPFIDIFTNLYKVNRIDAPVYLVHGMKDRLISYRDCKRMDAVLTKHNLLWKARYIPEGDHNNLMMVAEEEILNDIRGFLKDLRTMPVK